MDRGHMGRGGPLVPPSAEAALHSPRLRNDGLQQGRGVPGCAHIALGPSFSKATSRLDGKAHGKVRGTGASRRSGWNLELEAT